ncbi:NAD(P)-binding protein [Aureobasidium pullulans]|uniref:NAD(P)-binding protein n=1 Tax=Aureobasidium pullulans TaxID=5580 RepID=A0A4S9DA98_AURPU|nr:NAD(P)-binding protein [Aureobasidium pullulans]
MLVFIGNTTFPARRNHQAESQAAFDSVAGGGLYPLTPVVLFGVTICVCDVLAVLSFNFFVFTAAMARVNKPISVVADVTAKGAAQNIVSQVEKELGPIDILVNNAGISRISPLVVEEDDLDIWWRVYEVNVRAPVSLIRAVLPSMIERNTGVLLTTGSAVATLSLPVMTAYSSSKAAISKFHESLAQELKETNVLSFAVHPGMVKTELGAAENAINKAHMSHPAMQSFLGMVSSADIKRQTPELCADTMVALAADSRYKVLTGRHINATQELPPVVAEAEKEGMGRLGKDRLYLITVPTL